MIDGLRRKFMFTALGAGGGAVLAPLAVAAGSAPKEVGLLTSYVAGMASAQAAEAARTLHPGDRLELRRAPDDPYDPRAVQVWTHDGVLLGIVPPVDNKALASLLDAGFHSTARVRAVAAHPVRPEVSLDIALLVA